METDYLEDYSNFSFYIPSNNPIELVEEISAHVTLNKTYETIDEK